MEALKRSDQSQLEYPENAEEEWERYVDDSCLEVYNPDPQYHHRNPPIHVLYSRC